MIEPTVVRETLAALDWARTGVVFASDAVWSPEAEVLARTVLDAAAQSVAHIAVITPPDAPLLALLESRTPAQHIPLPVNVTERFGALSPLGLFPAALLGVDLERLHELAHGAMLDERGDDFHANPGARLGVLLAVCAQHGRDTLTLLAPRQLGAFTEWIKGFVAGSLSKHGRGFVPVVGESRGAAEDYRQDRIFVELRLDGVIDPTHDALVESLRRARQPVVTLCIADRYALAAEIVRWQVAVAVAAMIIGLNPFDEPDTASMRAYIRRQLAQGDSWVAASHLLLSAESVAEALPLLESARQIAVVAFLPQHPSITTQVELLRSHLHHSFGATTVSVFPWRDQDYAIQLLHAGRPGLVPLVLSHADASPLTIPSLSWTVNDLCRAYVQAELDAWKRMDRRFVHVNLGPNPTHGLRLLNDYFGQTR